MCGTSNTFLSAEDAEGAENCNTFIGLGRAPGDFNTFLGLGRARGNSAPFWGWRLGVFSDESFALQFAVAAEVEEEADFESSCLQVVEDLGVFSS